jgi:hypothetical protein
LAFVLVARTRATTAQELTDALSQFVSMKPFLYGIVATPDYVDKSIDVYFERGMPAEAEVVKARERLLSLAGVIEVLPLARL